MGHIALPKVTPNASAFSFLSNTGQSRSIFNNALKTIGRAGALWRAQLNWHHLTADERYRMQGFAAKLDGQRQRAVFYDHSYVKRGAIVSTDLITNGDFSNGIANWEVHTSGGSIHASDVGLRFRNDSGIKIVVQPTTTFATVAGLSYCAALNMQNAYYPVTQSQLQIRVGTTKVGIDLALANFGDNGQRNIRGAIGFTAATSASAIACSFGSARFREEYDLHSAHVARAFLVDNGGNFARQSADFDTAPWGKFRVTITSDDATGPDDVVNADKLVEDATAANNHYVITSEVRTSAQEFWTAAIWIREDTQRRIFLYLDSGAAPDYARAGFDSNTGTIWSTPAAAGTTDLPIASMHGPIDGWYRCRVSGRLAASTTVRGIVYLIDGTGTTTIYDGDGVSGLHIVGFQLNQTAQLGRHELTTTAAIASATQAGDDVFLKGLDPSVNGQLLAGDMLEINGQLLKLTADLDGDESGEGIARVSPPLRSEPPDDTPAVIYRPHGRFILGSGGGWSNEPGPADHFSELALEFIEDPLP